MKMRLKNIVVVASALFASSVALANTSTENKALTQEELEQIVQQHRASKENEGKAEKALVELSTIISGVKNIYASAGGFRGLNNNILMSAGVIPANIYKNANQSPSDKSVSNIWGGNITFQEVVLNVEKDIPWAIKNVSAFEIVYQGVPQQACEELPVKLKNFTVKLEIVTDGEKNIVFNGLNTTEKAYDARNATIISNEKLKGLCKNEKNNFLITAL